MGQCRSSHHCHCCCHLHRIMPLSALTMPPSVSQQRSPRLNVSKPWFFIKHFMRWKTKRNASGGLPRVPKQLNLGIGINPAIKPTAVLFVKQSMNTFIKNNPKKFWKIISPSDRILPQVDSSGLPVAHEHCSPVFNNFTALVTKKVHSNMLPLAKWGHRCIAPITSLV